MMYPANNTPRTPENELVESYDRPEWVVVHYTEADCCLCCEYPDPEPGWHIEERPSYDLQRRVENGEINVGYSVGGDNCPQCGEDVRWRIDRRVVRADSATEALKEANSRRFYPVVKPEEQRAYHRVVEAVGNNSWNRPDDAQLWVVNYDGMTWGCECGAYCGPEVGWKARLPEPEEDLANGLFGDDLPGGDGCIYCGMDVGWRWDRHLVLARSEHEALIKAEEGLFAK